MSEKSPFRVLSLDGGGAKGFYTLGILRELNYEPGRIILDHNTEDTMDLARKMPVWAGMTVYP